MTYAVIGVGGKQYLVRAGETITLDRLTPPVDSQVIFDQVYLVVDADRVSLGQPLVAGASVRATVVAQMKGPKIRIATYKAKSRHRRVKGHRQPLTLVKINAILERDVQDKTGRKNQTAKSPARKAPRPKSLRRRPS